MYRKTLSSMVMRDGELVPVEREHIFQLVAADIPAVEEYLKVYGGLNGFQKYVTDDSVDPIERAGVVEKFVSMLASMAYCSLNDENELYKDPEGGKRFLTSFAYNNLITEFFTDENAFTDFVTAIMPDVSQFDTGGLSEL